MSGDGSAWWPGSAEMRTFSQEIARAVRLNEKAPELLELVDYLLDHVSRWHCGDDWCIDVERRGEALIRYIEEGG